MDELRKLYDVLVREGKYTKSFEEFQAKWTDQAYKDKVFDVVSRDGLYTKDKNSFFQKYSGQEAPAPSEELKKKEEPVITESSSEDSSLASSIPQPNLPTAPKAQDLPQGQGQPFKMDLSGIKPKETALTEEERTKIETSLPREGLSIESLESTYGKKGFKFRREKAFGGLSDNLIVANPNGQEMTVAINNFTDKKNKEEFEKLQNFIRNSPKADEKNQAILEGKTPNFSKSISVITPEMISGSEEKAVPLMNYHFGDLGFKFEESGMTGDWMMVTAPDGTKMEISLDNWSSDKDKSQAEKLKSFITKKSNLQSITSVGQKIQSDKEIKDSISAINKDANDLVQEKIALNHQYELLSNTLNQLESTPYEKRDSTWIKKYNEANKEKQSISDKASILENKRSNLQNRDAQLQSAAGKYYTMKGEQGTRLGFLWNEFEGAFGKAGAGMQNLKLEIARKIPFVDDIIMAANYGQLDKSTDYKDEFIKVAKESGFDVPADVQAPISESNDWATSLQKFNDWKNSIAFGDVRREEVENKILNNTIRGNKEGISETVIKGYTAMNDPNTTVEYSDLTKKGFWGGAIASLIDFAPAMIGTPINKAATMFAMSNENMQKEFNSNPAFKDASETDKMIYALPFNLANSVLLEFGLNKVMANKSFVADLVNTSLSKAGAKATVAELKNIMKGEVNNMLARGGIAMTKSALAGAELGAAMHISDQSIRQFYNNVSGKEMLKTPDSITEFLKETGESMASMAVGGAILAIPSSIHAAVTETGYKGMSNDQFALFESAANNSDLQTAFVTNLKNKVLSGDITTAQAKETLNNYRNSVGLFRELPEGLDINAKKEAMDLLKEKRDLENKIKDKDKALVKPQQDRIDNINQQLTKLSEDAIQKQKSDESLLRAGEEKLGLQEVGEGNAEPTVTTGEETITPEGTEEIVTKIPEEISSLNDDETVTFRVKNIDEIPEQFRDRAVKKEGLKAEVRKKIFGLPIGEKSQITFGEGYTYELTGKEAKDYAESQLTKEPITTETTTTETKTALQQATENQQVPVSDIEAKVKETNAKIKRKNLFDGVGVFSKKLGGSNKASVPVNHAEINGIEFVQYANPDTGSIDVVVSGESGRDYVGFYRLYENGEPTNKWSSKFENQSRNKENFKTMISNIQKMLPIDHEYTEKTSISTDGLRVWSQQLKKGYELQYDKTGKIITKEVGINGDSIVNELGIPVSKGEFKNISVKTKEDFEKVREKLLPYMEKLGLGADNIRWTTTTVKVELPVLKYTGETSIEKTKEITPETKSLADKIRAAKVGKGKAFDAILGIPVAIWDGSVELVAKGIEAGKSLSDAIKSGIKYIKENHTDKFDTKEYERGIKEAIIPGYKDTMREIQDYADYSTRNKEYWEKQLEQAKASGNKKNEAEAKDELTKYTEGNLDKALKILTDSDTYKNATYIEKEELVRDVRERFELKEKKAPSTEKLLGKPEEKKVTMTDKEALKKQIMDIAKGAKEGAKFTKEKAREAKRKLMEYINSVKDYGNLTREDWKKMLKEADKVEDEVTLDKVVDKINNIIDNAKTDIIEISEYKMLREMMLAIKEAKDNINEKRKILNAAIENIKKSGEISGKKVGTLIKKLGKVNLDSDVEMEKVIEYAEKIFSDAEYDNKLKKAKSTIGEIRALSKNPIKAENLTSLGKMLVKIKPSMVEDIDLFNEIASKVKEAIKGSTIGKDVKEAEMVDVKEVKKYIDDTIKKQQEKEQAEREATEAEIIGEDISEMTEEEKKKLLEEKKTIIKEEIKKRFQGYVNLIKEALTTGKNPLTDEDLDVSESKEKLVKRFMGMDVDLMSPKDALQAVDALKNFLYNGSTARMETVVSEYQRVRNAERLADEGFRSKQLRQYWNYSAGRVLAEQFMTIPMLVERMFGGNKRGRKFSEESGFTELKNKKTLAQFLATSVKNEYIKEFFEKKANGKSFDTAENQIERGILAAVKRTVIGTPEEQQAEFKRKKDLIEESIKELKTGDEKERKLADLYEKVYDKVLKNSNNVDEVVGKSDATNLEAVNFWIKKWSDIYDELADISESIYNKELGRDKDYIPDVFKRLFNRGAAPSILDTDSLFHAGLDGVYKRKTGVLEESQRIDKLPKDEETKKVNRYLDLSFDTNNANAYYDALMDIHTSSAVRGIEAFFKSPAYDKIVPYAEDRAILYNDKTNPVDQGAIQRFIRTIRGKDIVSNDEASKMVRTINRIATLGTSAALAGFTQPFKQTIPVGFNTFINTGGKLDFNAMFNKSKVDFMNRSGYGIAVRGIESLTSLDNLAKSIQSVEKSGGSRYIKHVEEVNKKMLRLFLASPDIWIARMSWMSYYEKALEKQGKDPSTIDYDKHEVNKEAADYAQSMVDRQQNISDADLQGKWLSSKDAKNQVINKVLMPFASFRINQTMRMLSDLSTLKKNSMASAEDKAIARRSLAGYAVEALIFRGLSATASIALGGWTKDLLGQKETDEDKRKRWNNSIKGQVTSLVSDIAPIPLLETPTVATADYLLSKAQELSGMKEEDIDHLFTGSFRKDVFTALGTLGIAPKKIASLKELYDLYSEGKFTDEYGREKYVSKKDKKALGKILGVSIVNTFYWAPSEVNSIINNTIKYVKKNASTKTPEQIQGKASLLHGYDNVKDMKRYDPELYDQTFGKESTIYQAEEKIREQEKEKREKEREEEDARRGYEPKEKEKSWYEKRIKSKREQGKKSWYEKRMSE